MTAARGSKAAATSRPKSDARASGGTYGQLSSIRSSQVSFVLFQATGTKEMGTFSTEETSTKETSAL